MLSLIGCLGGNTCSSRSWRSQLAARGSVSVIVANAIRTSLLAAGRYAAAEQAQKQRREAAASAVGPGEGKHLVFMSLGYRPEQVLIKFDG